MDGLPLENRAKSVEIDRRRLSYSAANFEGTDGGQQNEAAQAAATRPRHETTPKGARGVGTNFETQIFKFRWFLCPSDKNELYHTPLQSKI